MIDESCSAVKDDFITALRIIYREGLSDAFAHLSVRSREGNEMLFMPRLSSGSRSAKCARSRFFWRNPRGCKPKP